MIGLLLCSIFKVCSFCAFIVVFLPSWNICRVFFRCCYSHRVGPQKAFSSPVTWSQTHCPYTCSSSSFLLSPQCSFWVFFFVAPCQIVYFSFIVQQLHQLLFVSFFPWTFSLRTLSPFGCVCFLWLPVFCQPLPLSLLTKQTQFNFTPSCPLSVTFESRYLPKCSCLEHQRYAKIYKQIPISACIFA